MTGIYLKCDKCGATLGGEVVTSAPHGLHWSQTTDLQKAARALGWTGELTRDSNTDRCPKCSMTQDLKYVTCIRCDKFISWFEHKQLRFAMDCPACGAKKQFGPDVYVPDFKGYTFLEVQEICKTRKHISKERKQT